MGIFDFLKVNKYKKDIENLKSEINTLTNKINEFTFTKDELKYIDLKSKIIEAENILSNLELEKVKSNKEIESLYEKIYKLEKELHILEDNIDISNYGFYKPKYEFENSSIYKTRLDSIRLRQKDMIKSKTATNHDLNWTIGNDKKKGKEFILDTIKLTLRAFNNECDNIMIKAKYNNIESLEKRIRKIFEELNKLTDMQNVSISHNYLKLKIEELYLKFEYECKLQEEKEEQLAIKERIREEAKAQKELEAEMKKIEKEEAHFNNAIKDINIKLSNSSDKEKEKLLKKLEELECKLSSIQQSKQNISEREKNTRAGYVYVISNIGSFGENIYKIGMTRRLDPMDRVKELGDASVPFSFDVHAMIFSEDAPSLENALHKKFEKYSVNKINLRKEFFNVPLDEIEHEINSNHNGVIKFTKIAQAEEYRQSLELAKNFSQVTV